LDGQADPWVESQLKKIQWKASFRGVLADFHPVTIQLASDHQQVAGYLRHEGDQRTHKLFGDWSRTGQFQLQERDENDRLTGYLTGTITTDLLQMDWISADQSRMFEIRAFPESLITIKNFKPAAEWIEINTAPKQWISVQKLDHGIVSGLALRNGRYTRFEGYCLDGTCTLWNTVIQNPSGAPVKVQMRQRDVSTYKVNLNGTDYSGTILYHHPIVVRREDNSTGFLDFVYPKLNSVAFETWLSGWLDPVWKEGSTYLRSINQPGKGSRLIHRSSGWIEILEETSSHITGMTTFIHPGSTVRTPFMWLKKEEVMLSMNELLNVPGDVQKANGRALEMAERVHEDEDYVQWVREAGYPYLLPVAGGVMAMTNFNMIYGDDFQLLPINTGKELIRKKYWKYFGW
jgi:hypothetical protein